MYETFYKFSGPPFQLNPDPGFFFGSRGHNRALAYFEYGIQQGEGFIVITGEVGAGKTTLVRSLLEKLEEKRFWAAQLVSTQLDAGDMLRSVATAFGIASKARDKAHLLAAIEAFLVSLARDGYRSLLVVDEAQNLTLRAIEELRMLSNYHLENRALLQTFLVGQPQLRRKLQLPDLQQFQQRVIASYHLGPLSLDETKGYVEHRLLHVGWAEDPSLEDQAFNAIFQASGGIPRRINALCNRLLLAACLEEKHQIDAADVESVATELQEELGTEGDTLEGVVPSPKLRSLAKRLKNIEETVASTADTVQKLIDNLGDELHEKASS